MQYLCDSERRSRLERRIRCADCIDGDGYWSEYQLSTLSLLSYQRSIAGRCSRFHCDRVRQHFDWREGFRGAGLINPKYIIVGVTYAPPGPQSNVSYADSTMVGTTTNLSSSYTDTRD